MPNVQDELLLEDWFHFEVSAEEVPEIENLFPRQPSYLSSSLKWVKDALPSGQVVLFSTAEAVTSFFGLKEANKGIRFARIISKLYQEKDSEQNIADVNDLLSQYAPGLPGKISNAFIHQGTKLAVRKLIVEKVVPYGLQTAVGSLTNKMVDSALVNLGLEDMLKNSFSQERVQQLIAKGIALSLAGGRTAVDHLTAAVEITNTSVLDDNLKALIDDKSNCYRNKTLPEIQQAYIRATMIKHLAEAIGAQVEELVKNHAIGSPNLEAQAGLFLAAKAIRASVEQAIKTQNGTAVSVDEQLNNATVIMSEHFNANINLFDCFKDIYALPAQQTGCEKIKLVKSPWLSVIVDNDKPHLVKMREAYVEAYNELYQLSVRQLEIVEYLNGQRDKVNFEQTKLMQIKLESFKLARENCLNQLEKSVEIFSRPIQNRTRQTEYTSCWRAVIDELALGLLQEQELISSSQEFQLLSASKQLEEAAGPAKKSEESSDTYLGWAYNGARTAASFCGALFGYEKRATEDSQLIRNRPVAGR